jgi:hypothetical protein
VKRDSSWQRTSAGYIHEKGILLRQPCLTEIWGVPQTLCEDPDLWETIHPEDRDHVKQFMRNHEEYEVVYRIMRLDASVR